jgi:hypothetical protein
VSGNPIFDELGHDILHASHMAGDWFHPHRQQSPAPAAQPVTVNTSPHQEDRMSLAADAEQFYVNAKNELAKFETALPGLVAQAHKLEGNPLADIALKAGEAVAGQVLPPEALAVAAKTVGSLVDDLISLYNPQGAAAPPAQA